MDARPQLAIVSLNARASNLMQLNSNSTQKKWNRMSSAYTIRDWEIWNCRLQHGGGVKSRQKRRRKGDLHWREHLIWKNPQLSSRNRRRLNWNPNNLNKKSTSQHYDTFHQRNTLISKLSNQYLPPKIALYAAKRMPRKLSGELPRTTIEANNWVKRLMNSTSQCWTPEEAHASTQTDHASILMSPSPSPTSRWNVTGGSSTMMSGDVTSSQPSSLTTNHWVRRRPTQSSDSFVGQFRLSIHWFANKEGVPGTIPVLLYSLSFIVRRMFRRSRQPHRQPRNIHRQVQPAQVSHGTGLEKNKTQRWPTEEKPGGASFNSTEQTRQLLTQETRNA